MTYPQPHLETPQETMTEIATSTLIAEMPLPTAVLAGQWLDGAGREGTSSPIAEVGDATMKRLFRIWNHDYKAFCVIADDQTEALTIAVRERRIRRANFYRKFAEETDQLGNPEMYATAEGEQLLELLRGDKSGIVEKDADGNWGFKT